VPAERAPESEDNRLRYELPQGLDPATLLAPPSSVKVSDLNQFVVGIDAGEQMSDFGMEARSPEHYESSAGRLLQSLLESTYPDREVVLEDRRYVGAGDDRRTIRAEPSTAQRITISPQLGSRAGEAGFRSRYDYRAVVGGQQVLASGDPKLDRNGQPLRDRSKDIVHIFEPTLQTNFLTSSSPIAREKQSQSLSHLIQVITRPEFADTDRFVYTIVTPVGLDQDAERFLASVQRSVAGLGKTVFVVHRKVGT
jgi:hypothetical protein